MADVYPYRFKTISGHIASVSNPGPGHYHFHVTPVVGEAFEFDFYDATYPGEEVKGEPVADFNEIETDVISFFQLLNEPS